MTGSFAALLIRTLRTNNEQAVKTKAIPSVKVIVPVISCPTDIKYFNTNKVATAKGKLPKANQPTIFQSTEPCLP